MKSIVIVRCSLENKSNENVNVIIDVIDHGPGIKEEALINIFSPRAAINSENN